jgi:hypothetical protein
MTLIKPDEQKLAKGKKKTQYPPYANLFLSV